MKNNLEFENLKPNPIDQFSIWLDEYIQTIVLEGIAMTFSTINKDGFPSSRIVYLRNFDEDGFTFFTNYNSNKGEEIKNNNKASMLFYWPEFERQVRIWGLIEKLENELSDTYFKNRPRGSQAGAWVSKQSKEIKDRISLEKSHQDFLNEFDNKIIPRPEFWGGYRLKPEAFEFWQGRANRLHNRFLYKQYLNGWEIKRLAP